MKNLVMKRHKTITASGNEWKPCVWCGRKFGHGETISAISNDDGTNCKYWFCYKCIDIFFPYIPPEWLALPEPKEEYSLIMVDPITHELVDALNRPKPLIPNRFRYHKFKRFFIDSVTSVDSVAK